jgi:hypothetical protein
MGPFLFSTKNCAIRRKEGIIGFVSNDYMVEYCIRRSLETKILQFQRSRKGHVGIYCTIQRTPASA